MQIFSPTKSMCSIAYLGHTNIIFCFSDLEGLFLADSKKYIYILGINIERNEILD